MNALANSDLQRKLVFDKRRSSLPQHDDYLHFDNRSIQRGSVFGRCLMCGNDVLFTIEHPNLRETLVCPVCRSYNRQRQIIASLSLELFGDVLDLRGIVRKLKKGTKILLLENVTNFAEALRYYAGDRIEVCATEFINPDLKSGQLGEGGIMHLDIEHTHFDDNYFDIILHADVFEHVANAPVAEKEQTRILKQGGKAVYTAPFGAHLTEDDIYAEIDGNKIKYHKEPVYHGDPSPREDGENQGGCLVFRVFSYPGMYDRYKKYRAKFSCRYLYMPQYGIIGNNAYVFIATKN